MINPNPHPNLRFGYKNYKDLEHYTNHVPDYPNNPSKHVTENLEAIYKSSFRRENGANGNIFEICFLDAMEKFCYNGDSIDPCLVTLHKDVVPPKRADADIWFSFPESKNASIMLMLKSSLRERWKQLDRDAFLAKHAMFPSPQTIGVILVERQAQIGNVDLQCLEKTTAFLERIRRKCTGLDNMITVYDEKRMFDLFSNLANFT